MRNINTRRVSVYIYSVYTYSDLPVRVSTNLPESVREGGRKSGREGVRDKRTYRSQTQRV